MVPDPGGGVGGPCGGGDDGEAGGGAEVSVRGRGRGRGGGRAAGPRVLRWRKSLRATDILLTKMLLPPGVPDTMGGIDGIDEQIKRFTDAGLASELDHRAEGPRLSIAFNSVPSTDGEEYTPLEARDPPRVEARGLDEGKEYLIYAYDPDAPSEASSWLSDIPHYLAGGVNKYAPHGQEVVRWLPPGPPKGTHRYIFCLCERRPTAGGSRAPPLTRPGKVRVDSVKYLKAQHAHVVAMTHIKATRVKSGGGCAIL